MPKVTEIMRHKTKSINLFWYSMPRLDGGRSENFGDYVSKLLAEKISGKRVVWRNPINVKWYHLNEKIHLAIGSILTRATPKCIVWGSGIMNRFSRVGRADFRAVRGPYTRELLLSKGYEVPEVYGDPALLFRRYFPVDAEKKYILGIVPHYIEYEFFVNRYSVKTPEVKVINLLDDPFEIIRRVNECHCILSSSLHGLIISHAYNVPSYRMVLTDRVKGDGVKFLDYFSSVGISSYKPLEIAPETLDVTSIVGKITTCPQYSNIQINCDELLDRLIETCPFRRDGVL